MPLAVRLLKVLLIAFWNAPQRLSTGQADLAHAAPYEHACRLQYIIGTQIDGGRFRLRMEPHLIGRKPS